MKARLAVLVFLAAVAGACQAARDPSPAGSKFSLEQLKAQSYADLGPDAVDAAAYPPKARAGYPYFVQVCSQCHTLARPLNGPEATRQEWELHIRRMHAKTLVNGWWTEFGKADAAKILDFLEYDSQVRKLDDKAAFAAKTAELKALFEEVKAERSRLQLEEGRRDAKPAAPYVGAKP